MGDRKMVKSAFGILVLWVVATVLLNPVLSQLVIDDKVYDCELPEGCPSNTQEYLTWFGYLNPERECKRDDIEAALTKFQEFNVGYKGLEVTRYCDNITQAIMKLPRCGCEDIVKFEKKMMPNNLIGPQQYNIGNDKWTKKTLTWMIEKYPQTAHNRLLPHGDVEDAMQRGLQIWADKTLLTFKQVKSLPADITIKFERGRHTTEPPYYDFDGEGNVLAHAFFPQSGVVHFDDDEKFVLKSDQGTELFIVAAHEFGHTLGISHSNINEALMAPYYRYSQTLQLHPDDIAAVQALYGRRDSNPRPMTTPAPVTPRPNPTMNPSPNYCNLQVRASFTINSVVHIFVMEKVGRYRETFVYKVRSNGLDPSSRTPVQSMFQRRDRSARRSYPYRVDAAEYIPDKNQIYLFSGTRVYRYTASSANDVYWLDTESNYPRWMDVKEFPERPRAAIVMPYSGRNYGYYMLIFGKTMVWDWNLYNERVGAWAYPISAFGQTMPQRVDAAYYDRRNNIVKFIKGDKFYNFSVAQRRVVDPTVYSVGKDFFKGECV